MPQPTLPPTSPEKDFPLGQFAYEFLCRSINVCLPTGSYLFPCVHNPCILPYTPGFKNHLMCQGLNPKIGLLSTFEETQSDRILTLLFKIRATLIVVLCLIYRWKALIKTIPTVYQSYSSDKCCRCNLQITNFFFLRKQTQFGQIWAILVPIQ